MIVANRTSRRNRIGSTLGLCALASLVSLSALPAMGQAGQTPIYTDDSTAASEGISRAMDQLAKGNVDEAVGVLGQLLRTEGARVMRVEDDPDLYHSVRDVIHRLLLRNPELFERYLAIESPEAKRLGDLDRIGEVERTALLTPAGFEAALRLAQRRLESAQFDSAWQILMSLEEHPQRRSVNQGATAAEMATLVARYLPLDARVSAIVTRWRDEAGLGAGDAASRIEGPDRLIGVTPFDRGPPVRLKGIVSRPLWSEPLSIATEDNADPSQRFRGRRGRNAPQPWQVFPTVGGDTIYVNDGITVAAWDRFTLAPKWRTALLSLDDAEQDRKAAEVARRGSLRSNRDDDGVRTVTTSGRWVVAAAEQIEGGRNRGPTVVVALDAMTGQVRWRMSLSQATGALDGATIEGRLLIDQGVVLVQVSKDLAERRLDSAQLLALELATGRPLWRRPLGSTGTLPFATRGSSADLPVALRGVVYLVDTLGFVAGVETVSGRTRWIRDLRIDRNLLSPREPWASMGPVVAGDSVYAITPDNQRIVELDAYSGREIASRDVLQLLGEDQSPLYLLDGGETLVIVGLSVVYGISLDDFADQEVFAFSAMDLESELFEGRAVIAGDSVIVPTRTGLRSAAISPDNVGEPELTHLEDPGNVLALESQLVVIDHESVRTYLLWDVAQRVLSERMELKPSDPTPAVTFAELAYRAGKPDRILPAVAQALASIERAPRESRNRTARSRLFRSLLAMVEPDDRDPQLGSLTRDQIESMLDELGRAASEAPERVEHLMARGRFYEAEERLDVAVDSYQRVLDDPRLSAAAIKIDGVSAQAQREATKSLRRVVRRFGPDVYAAYEIEAQRMLVAIMPGSGPEVYTALAQRYPVSRAGAQAWLESASAYLSRGRPHGAVFALESGLQTAEDALALDDELVGELAGRLINLLAETGRVAAASEMLDRLTAQRPMLRLTSSGTPLMVDAMRAGLNGQLAMLDRRPRVGLLGELPSVQSLDGWSIMIPIKRRATGTPTDAILMEREGEIGLWEVSDETGLTLRWAAPSSGDSSLVDFDDQSVFLTHRDDQGWTILRHDMITGDQTWKSATFASLFQLDPGEQDRTTPTPLDGARPALEQLIDMDELTLVIIDRGGRAVAYDKATGRERWRLPETLDVIVDIAVNAGVVALVGARDQGVGGGSPIPTMLVIDSRTGQIQHRVDLETGHAHWVRVTDSAEAIVGASGAISLYDVFTGRRRWSVGGSGGRQTTEAWVFPGRVIALNDLGELLQIETESGASMGAPLDTRERVTAVAPLKGGVVGDRAAFATTIGILLFDRRGELVGVDHRPTSSMIHPAEFGAERFVTISMVPGTIEGEVYFYDIQIFSMESCSIEQQRSVGLFSTPTRIAILDGRILVTSGPGTVILDTE